MTNELGVQSIGKLETELGLGVTPVWATQPMEATVDAVVFEVVAGRDDLAFDRHLVHAFDLADVGRLARPEQRLPNLFPEREDDVEREIAAARRASLVVSRATWSGRTRVAAGEHGQRATGLRWLRQVRGLEDAASHDGEAPLPVSQRTRPRSPHCREPAPVAMGAAARRPGTVPALGFQEPARDVDPGIHDRRALEGVGRPERDAFAVAQKPGSERVALVRSVVEIRDAQGDLDLETLPPQSPTGRNRGHVIGQRAGAG